VTKVLLSLHVIAAILAVGPVAVAASMFPAAVRSGRTEHVRLLHRICRGYAVIAIAVPVFGFATAGSLGVTGQVWLLVSIALTAVAAAVLVFLVLPRQRAVLASDTVASDAVSVRVLARLGMYTGVFNLLWAAVTVLMIVRPGSTTGV
jgi:hypothetical protein